MAQILGDQISVDRSMKQNTQSHISGVDSQPLNSTGKAASKVEQPKAAVSNRRWVALKRSLVPLAPVPVTILVVTLNFMNWFYLEADDNFISEVQNALQFAAHAYGTLIVTSVSAIVLHRIRYELLEGGGLALGYLLAGYQLSHLETLLSKEFWSSAYNRNRRNSHSKYFSLLGLIVLSMFLVNLASPMAAIAIVPKPAWWIVPSKLSVIPGGFINAFVANTSELWPVHLTKSQLADDSCLDSNATLNESCPVGGYPSISETVPNWSAELYSDWNISFFNDDVTRQLTSYATANDSSLTSSVGQVLARSIGDYYQWPNENWKLTLASANGNNLLMPLVQVECAESLAGSDTLEFPYGNLIYPPLHDLSKETRWMANVTGNVENATRVVSKPVQFTWIDLSNYNPGPSLGAVFRVNQSGLAHSYDSAVFTCTVDARWAPVQLYIQPTEDPAVYPNILYQPYGTPNLQQIQIDPEWSQALNIQLPDTEITTIESLIQSLVSTDLVNVNNMQFFLSDVAAALGLTVTDGLARIGWDENFAYTSQNNGIGPVYLTFVSNNGSIVNNTTPPPINPEWLQLNFTLTRYGYGYSISTITVKIAIAFLLLHTALALAHAVVLCASRRTWSSDSWGSIGELVVLALGSRPNKKKLQNMCAGVSLSQTWQQVVKIKEVGEDNLELVAGGESEDEKDTPGVVDDKPKPNKVYGSSLGELTKEGV